MSGFLEVNLSLWMALYMLEMNTNPGFSPASILPQQAKIFTEFSLKICGKRSRKTLKK